MAKSFASLATIDLDKLIAKDTLTKKELLHAAESTGFFYVGLRGSSHQDMIAAVEALFCLSHAYFTQSEDIKIHDRHENSDSG